MNRFKMTSLWSWKVLFSLLTSYPLLKDYLHTKLSYNDYSFYFYNWAATTSWVIAPWWFCVSLWRICITFVWPSSSLKLPVTSSQSECHLHFALIRLCLALLFIISILLFLFWIEIVNCHVHCAMPVLLRITSLRRQATPMRQSSIPMLLFDRFRSSQKTSLLQDECRHLECPRLWLIMMIS